ncbi:hypothetical protein EON66_05785 [archaeon]|nr:MAG: hypothetical protein EON66_05785 [archaeon]
MSGNAANTSITSISVDGSVLQWNANEMSAASVRVHPIADVQARAPASSLNLSGFLYFECTTHCRGKSACFPDR